MRRVLPWLAGLLLLLGMCAVNQLIFTRWFDTSYFGWYLANGSVIGLTTSIVSLAWGDINRHIGLISAHPLNYVGSNLQLAGLPMYEMGTRLRTRKGWGAGADTLIASLVTAFLAGAILLWVQIVVPVQYFVYLLCGAPGRVFHGSRDRVAARLVHGARLEVLAFGPGEEPQAGWWEAGLGGKPVALTGIVTALFLTILRWIL